MPRTVFYRVDKRESFHFFVRFNGRIGKQRRTLLCVILSRYVKVDRRKFAKSFCSFIFSNANLMVIISVISSGVKKCVVCRVFGGKRGRHIARENVACPAAAVIER